MNRIPTVEVFKDGKRSVINATDAEDFAARGWLPLPPAVPPVPPVEPGAGEDKGDAAGGATDAPDGPAGDTDKATPDAAAPRKRGRPAKG